MDVLNKGKMSRSWKSPSSYGRVLTMALLALVLAGCGAEDEDIPPAKTAAESSTMPEVTPLAGEILYARVESGEWNLSRGLVLSLQVAAGELDVAEVYPNGVVFAPDIARVIRIARRYLKSSPASPDSVELERLLNLLRPDFDAFDELVSNEAGPTSAVYYPGEQRFRLLPTQSGADCTGAWLSDENPLSACFSSYNTGRIDFDLFYPSYWNRSASQMADVARVSVAINRSIEVFRGYGRVGNTRVVMIDGLYNGDDGHTYAAAGLTGQRCDATVYFPSLLDSSPRIKQTLAHELFHCFQQWNMPRQFFGDDSDEWVPITDWWVEGTAEHFSNVVYPALNDEWYQWADRFDGVSPFRPITDMKYEATVFWQYLEWQIGNAGIIDLLKTLPTNRSRTQAEALAGHTGLDRIFHEFGKDYLDGEIMDTASRLGGEVYWPLNPVLPEETLEAGEELELEVERLVLGRRYVNLVGDRELLQRAARDGAAGSGSLKRDMTAWESLEARKIFEACSDRDAYQFVMTTVEVGNTQPMVTTLDLRETGEGLSDEQCDDCKYPTVQGSGKKYDESCYYPCMDACWCARPSMHEARPITLGECQTTRPVDLGVDYCPEYLARGNMRADQALKVYCTSQCAPRCFPQDAPRWKSG